VAWQDDLFGPPQPIEAVNGQPAPAAEPWSWVPQEWLTPEPPPPDPLAATATPELGVPAPAEPVVPSPTDALADPLAFAQTASQPVAPVIPPPSPVAGVPGDTFEQAMAGGAADELGQLREAPPDYQAPAGHVTEAPPDVAGDAARYAAMTPEQRAAFDSDRAETQRQDLAAKQLTAATEARQQAELDFKAHNEARAIAQKEAQDVAAEAKALANESIDGGRWWSSRSVPQKVAGFLAAIVGGLVQGRRGGPNEGLAMIEKEIDRDIEVQKANLQNKRAALGDRRGAVNDQFARIADQERSDAVHRAASWEHVERTLLAEQQNYDPAGTRAQRIGQAVVEARSKKAAAMAAFEEKNFERKKELIKIDQEQQKINETARAAQVKERAAAAAGAATAANARAENVKHDPAYYAQQGLAVPPIAMSEKQYTTWTGRREKQYEMGKEERAAAIKETELQRERGISGQIAPIKDADGNTIGVENKPLTQKDGKPWVPSGSTAAVDKLREQKGAADQLVNVIDEVLTLGPEYLSDTANSEKLQQLKQLWATAKLETKDFKELGVIAGPDLVLIEDFLGTPDPTRWKSSTAGIKQARKTIVGGIKTKMQAAGFTGDYNPESIGDTPKPQPTAEEQAVKDLATSRAGQDVSKSGDRGHSAGNLAEGVVEFGSRLGGFSAVVDMKRRAESDAALGAAQKTIASIGERARSKHNATSKQAVQDLANLAKTATSPGVREMAIEELRRVTDPSATYEIDEEPLSYESSSTARDTLSTGKGK